MSSWLSDPDANRYLQTYFNNFVEISGNLICNNGAFVDISDNIQLKNGAQLRFPDGTYFSTASVPLPTDISLNTIDVSYITTYQLQVNTTANIGGNVNIAGDLDVSGSIIFQDDTVQTTAYTPATTISVNNIEISGNVILPTASISNDALQSSVVLIDAVQSLTNKTISSTGITDSATASLTNLSVSGTVSIPNYSPSSLTVGNLTADYITVNNNEIIQQDLTVNGNVAMNQNAFIDSLTVNQLDWSPTSITVRVPTGTGNVFLCSATQVGYTSLTGTPATNDYIDPEVHNSAITNFGSNGAQITTVNSTTNTISFNQAIGSIPTATVEVYGYGLTGNTIQTYSPLTVVANQGVLGPAITDISFNRNYVSSVNNTNKSIITAGTCVGISSAVSFTGVIDSNNNLLSTSMPPVYSLMGSGSAVQRIESLVNARCANLSYYTAPTQTATAGTIVGYVMDSIKLNYATTSGTVALNQFIKSSTANDYTKGASLSVINTTSQQVEFSNNTFTRDIPIATVDGIIPYAGGNVLLASNIYSANNNFVEGSGVTSYKNNITGYTTGSYIVSLAIGSGLSKSPNTSINGYLDTNNRLVVEIGTTIPLSPNPFLYDGAGLTLTVPNRVTSQQSAQVYNITAPTGPTGPTARTSIVGFAYDTNRFCYTTATSPVVGDFISYASGARVTAVDTTKQMLTVTASMTPNYVVQNRLGHITSTTTIQLFDTTSLAVNQGVQGTGVSDTRPFISALNTTTKVVTMPTASLTVPSTGSVGGLFVLTSVAGVYKMGFKSSVPANTFITGTGITAPTYTNTTGVVTTLTYNTLPTVATARITKNLYLISNTQAVYNPIGSTTFLNNGDMLFANSLVESTISPSTYAVSPPSTTTDCSITLTNGLITPSLAGQIYGAIRDKGGSTYNFHYKTLPTAGQYIFNSDSLSYNNGGFIDIFPAAFDQVTLLFGNTTDISATAFAVQTTGYVGTDLLPYYSHSTAVYNDIIANGLDAIVQMDDGVNINKTGWLSSVSSISSQMSVKRASGVNVNYSRTPTTKNYTLYMIGDKSNIYVELQAGGSGVPNVDDFIDWDSTTNAEYGYRAITVTSTGTNRYRVYSNGAYINVIQSVGRVVRFITPQPLNFWKKTLFNVYNAVSTRVYTPNTITTNPSVEFDFLTSFGSIFKYTGQTYTYLPPINYSIYEPNTYSLSTPASMSYFNPVLYRFFTPQNTGFYGTRLISIPQITDPTGDTFALCKYPQTLTNKDLTSPTINTYSFGYIPWTTIQNFTGTWSGAGNNPLLPVLTATTTVPTPASNAGTKIRYMYSVSGKNLYMSYFFRQPVAGTAGTGTYLYKIPTQFHSVLSPMLESASNLTTVVCGTRLGSAVLHGYGNTVSPSSVYYWLQSGTPYILLYRELTTWGPQGSSNFAYSFNGELGVYFEAIIPLA